WRLLGKYNIPTFIFVNKMDMEGADRSLLLRELKSKLSEGCVNFATDYTSKSFMENVAICDESLLEKYLEKGDISTGDIIDLVSKRRIFPCYFGSALKIEGIDTFIDGLGRFAKSPAYPEEFAAKVYKISRDEQGNRITYMKITGGILKVKMALSNSKTDNSSEAWEEKIDQIRIYSGDRYETVDEVKAGAICAVTGLTNTYPGEGLGIEEGSDMPLLEPVLNYKVILPPETNEFAMLSKLRELEEEDPQLHIVWSEQLQEIHVKLMGEVQVEILKNQIFTRFGVNVEFGPGNIVYKETIFEPVIGIGHFEPLRHYAEVHLLMEPREAGGGLEFSTKCSEDVLDRNWQRLVLTHLEEKEHLGVLTGSPITDMKITLITGRSHLKHTEGGDFRQATYRAVRQGLKKAKSILLEPYYSFKLEVPSEMVGRAMTDLQRMNGEFLPPEIIGDISILVGSAPVATMGDYHKDLRAYSRGRGKLFCTLKGYEPCHNTDEVIQKIGYNSEGDIGNPASSVFCSHGVGFIVDWDRVDDYKHLDSGWKLPANEDNKDKVNIDNKDILINSSINSPNKSNSIGGVQSSIKEDKELEDIFTRTFGPIKERYNNSHRGLGRERSNPSKVIAVKKETKEEYLLVDGYNIIFSWKELKELADENLDGSRNKLMDILSNYQGFKKINIILVFDAYKVKGGLGEVQDYHNIHVVYTKEAETADAYIEKVTHELTKNHHVTVATSDALEQLIILGHGGMRLTAKELKEDIIDVGEQIRRDYIEKQKTGRSYIGDQFSEEIWKFLKD
ncbi:MAG: translation elongation factor G, partial [Clostridiales bacterium]|nr:translation elongation factor G [Clostridiales bacterium]